jgi:hypothetical protein
MNTPHCNMNTPHRKMTFATASRKHLRIDAIANSSLQLVGQLFLHCCPRRIGDGPGRAFLKTTSPIMARLVTELPRGCREKTVISQPETVISQPYEWRVQRISIAKSRRLRRRPVGFFKRPPALASRAPGYRPQSSRDKPVVGEDMTG